MYFMETCMQMNLNTGVYTFTLFKITAMDNDTENRRAWTNGVRVRVYRRQDKMDWLGTRMGILVALLNYFHSNKTPIYENIYIFVSSLTLIRANRLPLHHFQILLSTQYGSKLTLYSKNQHKQKK